MMQCLTEAIFDELRKGPATIKKLKDRLTGWSHNYIEKKIYELRTYGLIVPVAGKRYPRSYQLPPIHNGTPPADQGSTQEVL